MEWTTIGLYNSCDRDCHDARWNFNGIARLDSLMNPLDLIICLETTDPPAKARRGTQASVRLAAVLFAAALQVGIPRVEPPLADLLQNRVY